MRKMDTSKIWHHWLFTNCKTFCNSCYIRNQNLQNLEIIGSRSTDKAKEFAKKFNCEKFGTYDDVISE